MPETESLKPPTEGKGSAKVNAPPQKKGWSNPALRMMGIPRISLPSRNWLIFWAVCASIGSGIVYDKYEQSKARDKWIEKVKPLGEEKYDATRIPRKLTIFIAPPPNDFLDASLKLFKKFIKPIMNSSAIDLEIFSETRQGDIRSAVADKIRQLRLEKLQEKKEQEELNKKLQYEKSWTKFIKEDIPDLFKKKEIEPERLVKRQELYSPKDVLGLYQLVKPIEPKRDDESNPFEAGGVVCIGRGAYKEYITGVHEGLLGPLEKPKELIEEEQRIKEEKQKEKEENPNNSNDDEEEEQKQVVKPYINPEDYSKAEIAPELDLNLIIKNKKNVPVLFEQPVYVFPVPNLVGFTNMPRKIYRYFTRRRLADDFGFRTTSIIFNKTRPYQFKDSLMAGEEELDWPKKWVETGKSKDSEWVQDLAVDDRVVNRMRVFDHDLLKKDNDENN